MRSPHLIRTIALAMTALGVCTAAPALADRDDHQRGNGHYAAQHGSWQNQNQNNNANRWNHNNDQCQDPRDQRPHNDNNGRSTSNGYGNNRRYNNGYGNNGWNGQYQNQNRYQQYGSPNGNGERRHHRDDN